MNYFEGNTNVMEYFNSIVMDSIEECHQKLSMGKRIFNAICHEEIKEKTSKRDEKIKALTLDANIDIYNILSSKYESITHKMVNDRFLLVYCDHDIEILFYEDAVHYKILANKLVFKNFDMVLTNIDSLIRKNNIGSTDIVDIALKYLSENGVNVKIISNDKGEKGLTIKVNDDCYITYKVVKVKNDLGFRLVETKIAIPSLMRIEDKEGLNSLLNKCK